MITTCLLALRNCRRGSKPWHDLLAYETTKRVIIKDPAIGLMRFFAIFLMFVYLCAYRIYTEMAYLAREPVTSIVQTSIRAPDSLPAASGLPYCSRNGVPPAEPAMSVLECTSGSGPWIAAPSFGGSELFVSTRIKDTVNTSSSNELAVKKFVMGPEYYTVGITFTVQALGFYHTSRSSLYSRSIEDLTTRLVDQQGTEYTNGLTRIGRFDIIRVSTLLHAAGIMSLDEAHEADPEVSKRYDGLVLLLNIDCHMNTEGSVSECQYKVTHMAQSAAETFVVSDVDTSISRHVQERRGIKLVISASGTMGRFDLPTLLLAWVSAVAMVEIVSIALDWLLTYFLPFKDIYKMMLYEESPSFHDLRSGGRRGKKAKNAIAELKTHRQAMAGEGPSPPNSPTFVTGADKAMMRPQSGLAPPSLGVSHSGLSYPAAGPPGIGHPGVASPAVYQERPRSPSPMRTPSPGSQLGSQAGHRQRPPPVAIDVDKEM